jgi:hypothetical protein
MFYALVMKQTLTFKALPEPHHGAIPATVIATEDLAVMPSPATESGSDPLEDIRVRAETVSALLKGIMDHGATRHWGINE